jgi:hypothetical protein
LYDPSILSREGEFKRPPGYQKIFRQINFPEGG